MFFTRAIDGGDFENDFFFFKALKKISLKTQTTITVSHTPRGQSTSHQEISLHIKIRQHAADSIQDMLFPHCAGIIQGHLDKITKKYFKHITNIKKQTPSWKSEHKNAYYIVLFTVVTWVAVTKTSMTV